MADRKRKRKRHAGSSASSGARPGASSRAAGGASSGAASGPSTASRRSVPPAPAPVGGSSMKRGYAKAELKNVAAREALEPIGPENRPRIVLIAVVWLALACAGLIYSLVSADGEGAVGQRFGNGLMFLVVAAAAYNTWRLRPWAIMGAQTIFALTFVFTILAALLVKQPLLTAALLVSALVSGGIFYRMINVMARVQKMDLIRRGEIEPTRRPD